MKTPKTPKHISQVDYRINFGYSERYAFLAGEGVIRDGNIRTISRNRGNQIIFRYKGA